MYSYLNKRKGVGKFLAAVLVACVSFSSRAAAPTPNAGSILQQIETTKPPSPSTTSTGLRIETKTGEALPSGVPFPVHKIRISGNTALDTATLHALVADAEGKNLNLSGLSKLAERITDYYHAKGYLLARAIIPAQVVRNGIVNIEVVEARYGKVSLDNHTLVSNSLLRSTLRHIQKGNPVSQSPLNHGLLLISDIPGVVVNATLKPGAVVGTSDLTIETRSRAPITVQVSADNYGNSYTGRSRGGASVNFFNPFEHGDILSLSVLSSGKRMAYARLDYDLLVTGGTHVGGSYSGLHYRLGESLSPLDAQGTAQVGSLWIRQIFARSPDLNVYSQIEYDHLKLRDRVNASNIRTYRHLDDVTVSLSGDARDSFLSTGITTWYLGWTGGRVHFDNGNALLADAMTAKTKGSFSKVYASLSRLQSLGPSTALYIALLGQWTNDNLDSSQKLLMGGPYTVRAYEMGAVSGDTGYLVTAALRHTFRTIFGSQLQVEAFVDSAHVTVNAVPWLAGANHANLSGAGLGTVWHGPDKVELSAFVATPTGTTPKLLGPTKSVRAWVTLEEDF